MRGNVLIPISCVIGTSCADVLMCYCMLQGKIKTLKTSLRRGIC